jgi:SAM-dependent methyltransferase
MATENWYRHEMRNAHDVLITCVGFNFGPNPEERLDEIRQQRYLLGRRICRDAGVTKDDVVVDLGSGCGFVTRAACELAGKVHCIDINKEFLDFTRNELSEFANVNYHLIDYAHFKDIADASTTFVYSTAVFIHFVYYDFLFYLIELNRILVTSGKVYIELLDADQLQLSDMKALRGHVLDYRKNRTNFRLLQPFSLTVFENLSRQLGFDQLSVTRSGNMACVWLRKARQPEIPEWLAAAR